MSCHFILLTAFSAHWRVGLYFVLWELIGQVMLTFLNFNIKWQHGLGIHNTYTCISREGVLMLNSSEASTLSWDFTSSITTARFTRESSAASFSMYSLKEISCFIVTAGGETGIMDFTEQFLMSQFATFWHSKSYETIISIWEFLHCKSWT